MKKVLARMFEFILALVLLLPIALLIIWSFTSRWSWPNLIPTGYTLRAWQDIFRQGERIFGVTWRSILQSISVAFLATFIALLSARAMQNLNQSIKQKMIFLMSLPMLIPATIFGMGIQVIFIRLGLTGTNFGLILSHLIFSLPYANFLLVDAYQELGLHLQEQAAVLGANPYQVNRLITLPILAPVLVSAFIMSFIVSFSQYFISVLIGGGSIQTYTTMMFPYLLNNDRTVASTYAFLFLLISLIVLLIFRWLIRYSLSSVSQGR